MGGAARMRGRGHGIQPSELVFRPAELSLHPLPFTTAFARHHEPHFCQNCWDPHAQRGLVPDHVVWSLFSDFCCLGCIAYVYSVKSRDRKMVGEVTGAQAYASTAK